MEELGELIVYMQVVVSLRTDQPWQVKNTVLRRCNSITLKEAQRRLNEMRVKATRGGHTLEIEGTWTRTVVLSQQI